jgi:UDP-3-O-[3-hydroxymyristoyl] glucosamine N-acyltransferase
MKASELADALGLPLTGAPDQTVAALAPLERAGPGELSFVVGARLRTAMCESKASLLIVPPALADECPVDHLVSPSPYASYAQASWILIPEWRPAPGVHPSAYIDPTATIGNNVTVGAFTSIGAEAQIGDDVIVGEGCRIADGVEVGRGTRLFPNVCLGYRVALGTECRVQSGAVIGGEGFGYAPTADGWKAIHQTGGVRIHDRVHIGANTTIDAGAIDATVIEEGVIIDNLIQVGHNVIIGQNTAIAACAAIGGSARIGRNCLIGGASIVNGHIEITDGVTITGTSFVSRSIDTPGSYGSAVPLQRSGEWRRTFAALSRLDEILRRVRKLEKATSKLES